MCGITGFVDFNKRLDESHLIQMQAALRHRGDDDRGNVFQSTSEANVGLAHQRLSIIDLSEGGHQPMTSSCGNYVLVFNGELYNYLELKKNLESKGCPFKTESDTEVVVEAWAQYGEQALQEFRGMFAFAIWDKKADQIYIVRDRVGVKPLYYAYRDGLFLFGSELKSLMANDSFQKEIDADATSLFIQYGYYPEPHTVFKKCWKLKSGHLLRLNLKTKETHEKEYWSVPTKAKNINSEEQVIEELEPLLLDSFQHRMVSDVPVGVFLSGGYDSSLVTAMLQQSTNKNLKTFTIGFEEEQFNEAPHAEEVANYLGTSHSTNYCSIKDARKVIPEIAKIYDEPFGDSSAIPTLMLSRIVKKEVKVALSADGGDELFAGYGKYMTSQRYTDRLKNLSGSTVVAGGVRAASRIFPLKKMGFNFDRRVDRVAELIEKGVHPARAMQLSSQAVTQNEVAEIMGAKLNVPASNFDASMKTKDPFNAMLNMDLKTYLVDDILTKVDRASMSVGLECREPLLDHHLIEFMAGVPYDMKVKGQIPKYLLKKIAHKYLPEKIMNRPKKGFSIPIIQWMRKELLHELEEVLSKEVILDAGIFDPVQVDRLKQSYLQGRDEDFRVIWFLFIFHQWYLQWMK